MQVQCCPATHQALPLHVRTCPRGIRRMVSGPGLWGQQAGQRLQPQLPLAGARSCLRGLQPRRRSSSRQSHSSCRLVVAGVCRWLLASRCSSQLAWAVRGSWQGMRLLLTARQCGDSRQAVRLLAVS